MSSVNLFFHSNKNQESNVLLSLMENEKIIKYFRVINIDTTPNVPHGIHVTPTIMIKDNATIYSRGDAFVWFSRIKEWKRSYELSRLEQKQIQQINNLNLGPTLSDEKIVGFDKDGMLGTSDLFSFFNNNIANEYDGGLPHSFVDKDNIENKIFTPPLANGSYKVSKSTEKVNETTQRKMIDKFSTDRNQQLNDIKIAIDSFNKSVS